jgi:hypothetical protein
MEINAFIRGMAVRGSDKFRLGFRPWRDGKEKKL